MTDNKRKHSLKIFFSACLVLIIAFIAFYPSLKCSFINWDDGVYVVNNTAITAASLSNLKRIFTSFTLGHYQPLTILSYLFDYQNFKLNPFGYHLTNLILHLFNCLLVFWFIYLVSKSIPASFITAILFGIHPLRVESVVWVSERKDVLYAFFYLLAVISYLYYRNKENKSKYYLLSILLFICSLLSKPMAVTLPLILLLLDYLLQKKTDKSVVIDKIPLFCLALIFSIIAIYGVHSVDAIRLESRYGFFSILSVASHGIIFYLGKIFLPINLSCLYPYRSFEYNPAYLYSIAMVIILLISVIISAKFTKKAVFGGGLFLITLLPVLQFVPISSIIVADRFTYVASVGIFFILAIVFVWLINKTAHKVYLKVGLISILILIVTNFAYLTYDRCKVWQNNFVLWNDVIAKYGNEYIPVAYFFRGAKYLNSNSEKLAFFDFKKSLDLYRAKLGLKDSQLEIYDEFIKSNNYTKLFNFLGIQFADIGKPYEATFLFKQRIRKDPFDAEAYLNLCIMYCKLGNYKDAILFGKEAVKLNPHLGQGHYYLATAYYFEKKYELTKLHLQLAESLGFNIPKEFGLPRKPPNSTRSKP